LFFALFGFLIQLAEYLNLNNSGLGNLIAKNEDEYVKLAMKLASDVPALQTLRMSLRELMSKSPVCDGANFILGLESTYRNMWHKYCKGDVPSLKRMELLEPPVSANENSEPATAVNVSEGSTGSIKANGFNSTQPPKLNINGCEENGGSLKFSSKQGVASP
jgi:hypothetical protein